MVSRRRLCNRRRDSLIFATDFLTFCNLSCAHLISSSKPCTELTTPSSLRRKRCGATFTMVLIYVLKCKHGAIRFLLLVNGHFAPSCFKEAHLTAASMFILLSGGLPKVPAQGLVCLQSCRMCDTPLKPLNIKQEINKYLPY